MISITLASPPLTRMSILDTCPSRTFRARQRLIRSSTVVGLNKTFGDAPASDMRRILIIWSALIYCSEVERDTVIVSPH
ncbi:MAG: hypothetical protein ABSG83_02050 [Roseiarcus sp.]|jgi:hypothetical protein